MLHKQRIVSILTVKNLNQHLWNGRKGSVSLEQILHIQTFTCLSNMHFSLTLGLFFSYQGSKVELKCFMVKSVYRARSRGGRDVRGQISYLYLMVISLSILSLKRYNVMRKYFFRKILSKILLLKCWKGGKRKKLRPN